MIISLSETCNRFVAYSSPAPCCPAASRFRFPTRRVVADLMRCWPASIGAVGVIVAPRGRLFLALGLKISGGKISEVEVIADPARLRRLDLAVLDG